MCVVRVRFVKLVVELRVTDATPTCAAGVGRSAASQLEEEGRCLPPRRTSDTGDAFDATLECGEPVVMTCMRLIACGKVYQSGEVFCSVVCQVHNVNFLHVYAWPKITLENRVIRGGRELVSMMATCILVPDSPCRMPNTFSLHTVRVFGDHYGHERMHYFLHTSSVGHFSVFFGCCLSSLSSLRFIDTRNDGRTTPLAKSALALEQDILQRYWFCK